MNSILLRAALPPIFILQMALSLFLLLRGHNSPGGGFIAGLLAAAALSLAAFTQGVAWTRRRLVLSPPHLTGAGLLVAAASGFLPLLKGETFMTGIWVGSVSIPLFGTVSIGTPFLFDIGVYLVVFGMMTSIAFELLDEREQGPGGEKWK